MKPSMLPFCAAALCMTACDSNVGDTGDDPRQELLQSWGDDVILPTYREFETKTRTLDDAAQALCEAPSESALTAAQESWWAARAPWKQSEILAFGPYTDEPLRLGPKIDFWPARVDTIEGLLAGTEPIFPEALGASARGFPVIEYLLYQPEIDVIAELQSTPRRCDYLLAVTGDLADRAVELRQAWDPAGGNYLGELVNAGAEGSSYLSLNAAVSEVVNRMAFTIENIRTDKLGIPLGNTTGGSPQPDKAESRFSGRSLDDIRDNLTGFELLYFGNGDADSLGLDDYAPEYSLPVREQLEAVRAALEQITLPLTQAVLDEPTRVVDVMEALTELQRLVQVDVMTALGLTPSFNDNDGD